MSTVAKNGIRLPAVSVVIAAFADERWSQLCDAIESVREQTAPALETVVVIDHNPALLDRARREFTDCTVIANTAARGASGARNTGAASCHGEIIAFLDDDARSSAQWLAALLCHFSRDDIVGVGGRIDPLWAVSRPRWFPGEFGWAAGFSYQGMPERAQVTEAAAAGIEVGAHSRTHPQLDQLPEPLARQELCTSKRRLEDELGLAVPGLAYPFGYSSRLVRQLAREAGYRYAYAVDNRRAGADADLFRQPRLTIRRATTMAEFRRLADGRATLRLREDRALTRGWSVVRRIRAACL